jgi:F0F1-type ATP synthase assembly protein I
MLGYPLAGYFIGWFIHRTFGGPEWIPILIMMLALVEGFREVYRIATRIAVDEDNGEDDQL